MHMLIFSHGTEAMYEETFVCFGSQVFGEQKV